jgi:tetratricopeptide (TPR) repeat protein
MVSPPLSPKDHKGAPGTSIVVLAAEGIDSFNDGKYKKAREFFSDALCSISAQIPGRKSRYEGHYHQSIPFEATVRQSAISTSTEYDEGMQAYCSTISLNDGISRELIPSAISFNIAQTYFPLREISEARKWLSEALDLLRVAGIASREAALLLVKILNCLGYCCYQNGDDESAVMLYQRSLTMASKVELGSFEHAAAALNCMGVLFFNQQPESEMAFDFLKQSLEMYKNKCDATSQEYQVKIATVLNNIGRTHYVHSKFEDALVAYSEALDIRRRYLGPDSMDAAATCYNIGQTHQQLKNYEDALQCFMEFLRIVRECLGDDTRDVALVCRAIAEVHHETHDLKLAHHFLCISLKAQIATFGKTNIECATTLNKLGNICYEMKDFESAMKYYTEGLLIEHATLPRGHQHIMTTITNIAHIQKQLGDNIKALAAYKHVYSLQVNSYGPDDIRVAETLSSVGLIEYHLKKYASSFESFQESLRIRRQCYGSDDHVEVASTLNSIGLVLFKQNMFNLAMKCFTESLRIRIKLLGGSHRDVAIVWYNIATIHFESGEDELAIGMYEETLRIERAALGDSHPDVIMTLQHLGQVYQQLGNMEKATDYLKSAIDMESKRHEPGREQELAHLYNLLGNVHLQLGQTKEMMRCYVEASRLYALTSSASGETLVIAGYNCYCLSKTNPPCAPIA